jgi:hypothetical protein
VFGSPDVVKQFHSLCKWMSARNALRLLLAYGEVKDHYAFVDPDNDTQKPGAGQPITQ